MSGLDQRFYTVASERGQGGREHPVEPVTGVVRACGDNVSVSGASFWVRVGHDES